MSTNPTLQNGSSPTVSQTCPGFPSCPVREKKKHKLGTMTTISKHLYPFIQHSECLPGARHYERLCSLAVPDVTVIHTRMFLECCFSALVISGVLSFPGGNRLDRMEVQALTNVVHTARPRLAPAALPLFTSLFMLQSHTSGFCLPPPLASTCLDPPCQITQRVVPYLRFQLHFP